MLKNKNGWKWPFYPWCFFVLFWLLQQITFPLNYQCIIIIHNLQIDILQYNPNFETIFLKFELAATRIFNPIKEKGITKLQLLLKWAVRPHIRRPIKFDNSNFEVGLFTKCEKQYIRFMVPIIKLRVKCSTLKLFLLSIFPSKSQYILIFHQYKNE